MLMIPATAMAPLPVYLLALSLFGLPHVLWELAWLRKSFPSLLMGNWLKALVAVLAVQAASRLGVWAGWWSSGVSLSADLLALTVLLAGAAWWTRRLAGWAPRLVAMLSAALGLCLLAAFYLKLSVGVLVGLSVLHNLTPLLLTPVTAWPGRQALMVRLWVLFGLGSVLCLALSGLADTGLAPPGTPADARWLAAHVEWSGHRILACLVYWQCVHYYVVLRLLPDLAGSGPEPLRAAWQRPAILFSTLLALYFWVDFDSARGLYAVAAGVHAWLEWPVILTGLAAWSATRTTMPS